MLIEKITGRMAVISNLVILCVSRRKKDNYSLVQVNFASRMDGRQRVNECTV